MEPKRRPMSYWRDDGADSAIQSKVKKAAMSPSPYAQYQSYTGRRAASLAPLFWVAIENRRRLTTVTLRVTPRFPSRMLTDEVHHQLHDDI